MWLLAQHLVAVWTVPLLWQLAADREKLLSHI